MSTQLKHFPHNIHKMFADGYVLYTVHSSIIALEDEDSAYINEKYKDDRQHLAVLKSIFSEHKKVKILNKELFEKKAKEIQFRLLGQFKSP